MKAVAEEMFDETEGGNLAPVRDVEFVEMPAKTVLNRCQNPRLPFRWTINPYRGCEFGCVYCYARYTHEFLNLRDPMDFERRIFVKQSAARVLARTLVRTPVGSDAIAIGTATDPYQPAERRFGITRSILQVFSQLGGLSLSITTKSALIVRDLDLLAAIHSRSRLSVNFSLITLNRRLQRTLEPRAPRPQLRLGALAALARAGIRCNLLMMPMIAGLTDSPAAIEGVIRAARRAGASEVWWRALFLKPAAARRFIPFIRERFPEAAPRIEDLYARAAYAPRAYDEELGAVFDRMRRKYGFGMTRREPAAPEDAAAGAAPSSPGSRAAAGMQLSLAVR